MQCAVRSGTFQQSLEQMKKIAADGYQVVPIMSPASYRQQIPRFGKAKDFIEEIESICGRKIIHSIVDAEPIGPKNGRCYDCLSLYR